MKSTAKRYAALRHDRGGAIEGLPLQLMILVIVAGLATTVIVGWMSAIDMPQGMGPIALEPGEIELDSELNGTRHGEGIVLEVTVHDSMGDPLPGAAVVLSGCGVSDGGGTVYAVTGEDGVALFSGLSMQLPGTGVGFLEVTATKSGYDGVSEARVLVV